MPVPLLRLDASKVLPQPGGTINPGVSGGAAPSLDMVRAPNLDLGSIDRAGVYFTRFADQAMNNLSAPEITAAQQATAQREKDLAAGGAADALDPTKAGPDAAKAQFASYANAFATTKGRVAGDNAADDFEAKVVPTLKPGDNFQEAAQDYLKQHDLTTGAPAYDATALGTFMQRIERSQMEFRQNSVRAAQVDGQQTIQRDVGNAVGNGQVTPELIQQKIALAKSLDPMHPEKAGPMVVQTILQTAKTPNQMAQALTALNAPGSWAPGQSFAQQQPALYAELSEHMGRQMQEATSFEAVKAYGDLQSRLQDFIAGGGKKGLPGSLDDLHQLQSDLDKTWTQYGGLNNYLHIRGQVAGMLQSVAEKTAVFNKIEQGVGNAEQRDYKSFSENLSGYLQNRGIDPLSPQAAGVIGSYNAIDENTKRSNSNSLTDGSNPELQAKAWNFWDTVSKVVGDDAAMALMSDQAKPMFQAMRYATMDGTNPQQAAMTISARLEKTEGKDVPLTLITGKGDMPGAEKEARDGVNKAVSAALNVNGWFNGNANISPVVTDHLVALTKAGALFQSNSGPMDAGQLYKDAAARAMQNIQVVPGTDGKPVVQWHDHPPQDAVRLGTQVMNPNTRQPENTSATAEKDLGALPGALPDIVGDRKGLTLDAAPTGPTGMWYTQRGLWTVLQAGHPLNFMAGSTVNLGGQKITIPATIGEATTAIENAVGKDHGFVLMPIRDAATGKDVFTLTYRPRFTETLPTTGDRKMNYKPAADLRGNPDFLPLANQVP